ncbi:hypothetical protein AOQ84DRAFT_383787 [Glonium stellatum]|uniref:Uncharacterized protein n=1 Tax=Glonium stellatum TaxID=574774 RepID=A0A8E2ENC2_9PEZI|nr:hypothetical protein AOQ84DRAFT_383787 [Glonium stellatum]
MAFTRKINMIESISLTACVFGGISAIQGAKKFLDDYKRKKTLKKDLEVQLIPRTISYNYNYIIAVLNDTPEINGVKLIPLKSLLDNFEADRRNAEKAIRSLSPETDDEPPNEVKKLLNDALEVTEVIISLLEEYAAAVPGVVQQLLDSDRPRNFCYGALLLQADKEKSIEDIAICRPSLREWGFICRHCNLSVGSYRALRAFEDDISPSRELLARSHLIACVSLQERAAFYKCLACFERGKEVDFRSAAGYERHIEEAHPNIAEFDIAQEEETKRVLQEELEGFLYKDEKEGVEQSSEDSVVDSPVSSVSSGRTVYHPTYQPARMTLDFPIAASTHATKNDSFISTIDKSSVLPTLESATRASQATVEAVPRPVSHEPDGHIPSPYQRKQARNGYKLETSSSTDRPPSASQQRVYDRSHRGLARQPTPSADLPGEINAGVDDSRKQTRSRQAPPPPPVPLISPPEVRHLPIATLSKPRVLSLQPQQQSGTSYQNGENQGARTPVREPQPRHGNSFGQPHGV